MSRFAFLKALPLIAFLALAAMPASAQTTDAHHDDAVPQTTPAPAMPGAGMTGPMMDPGTNGARNGAAGGMGGMMQMMQMMQSSQMMQMAQMMQMMQMIQAMPMMPSGSGMTAMPATPRPDVETLIAGYQQALGITEAEMPQWQAFAESLRAGAKLMHDAAPAGDATGLPAVPEQLKIKAAFLAAESKAIAGAEKTAAALYAVLSEPQKRLADRLMADHLAGM